MKFASDPFMYTEYYAPRGRKRLLELGNTITSQYLSPEDRCIGILGEAGSGKSLIVRGMFPGLQLTNDDEDVYTRPLPLMDHFESGRFRDHTYHMDVRFESAFTQPYRLARPCGRPSTPDGGWSSSTSICSIPPWAAMQSCWWASEKRSSWPGPTFSLPSHDIAQKVLRSIHYRRMVHTAEDLVCHILDIDYGIPTSTLVHGDVKRGFLLEFEEKPSFSVEEVQKRAKEFIDAKLDVCYLDEHHIRIGDALTSTAPAPASTCATPAIFSCLPWLLTLSMTRCAGAICW